MRTFFKNNLKVITTEIKENVFVVKIATTLAKLESRVITKPTIQTVVKIALGLEIPSKA